MADGSATWIAKPSITNQAIGICIFDRVSTLRSALQAAEDMREWVVQRQGSAPSAFSIPMVNDLHIVISAAHRPTPSRALKCSKCCTQSCSRATRRCMRCAHATVCLQRQAHKTPCGAPRICCVSCCLREWKGAGDWGTDLSLTAGT